MLSTSLDTSLTMKLLFTIVAVLLCDNQLFSRWVLLAAYGMLPLVKLPVMLPLPPLLVTVFQSSPPVLLSIRYCPDEPLLLVLSWLLLTALFPIMKLDINWATRFVALLHTAGSPAVPLTLLTLPPLAPVHNPFAAVQTWEPLENKPA